MSFVYVIGVTAMTRLIETVSNLSRVIVNSAG